MSSEAFNPAGWSGYFTITSDNLLVDEAVGNAYYDLSSAPASFWSAVKSDGGDIRVTNSAGDTAYSYELAGFDSASNVGSLFFDSAALSTSADTTWRIYAGNSGASLPAVTDTLGARNVWDASYIAVWHLDEDPSGSAPQMTNSNNANHNLTSAGSMTSGDSVAGVLGDKAVDFDGSDDRLTAADHAELDITGDMTIEVIFKRNSTSGAQRIVDKGTNSYVLYFPNLDTRLWFGRLGVADIVRTSSNLNSTATWYNVMATREGTGGNSSMFVNGARDEVDIGGATFTANTTALNIAQANNNTARFAGIIDELRISSVARSENWHTTHDAMFRTNSTFWTTGAWVVVTGQPTVRRWGRVPYVGGNTRYVRVG